MIVIGIDPGKQGAIAIIGNRGIYCLEPTPLDESGEYDIEKMNELLRVKLPSSSVRAVIESQQARPIQGVKAAFSMGYGYGIWTSLLTFASIPFITVRPQEWQKEMFHTLSKNARKDTKAASARIAKQRYPSQDFKKTPRCKKVHDGLTDAVCLSLYGRCITW